MKSKALLLLLKVCCIVNLFGQSSGSDLKIIDLLVVYTTNASNAPKTPFPGETEKLDINKWIDETVMKTNQAMRNSGVNLRIDLVHKGLVGYTEESTKFVEGRKVPGTGLDLDNLREGNGALQLAHTWRDEYHADVVMLIRYNKSDYDRRQDGLGGRANALYALDNGNTCKRFAAIKAGNTSPFMHELGHILGTMHDAGEDRNLERAIFEYAHGFTGGNYTPTSLVGGLSEGRDKNIGQPFYFYSNPELKYRGYPLGDSRYRNSALTLNQTAATISECVSSTVQWEGSISTDWNNPQNWSANRVPRAIDDVLIPPASTHAPQLSSGTASVRELEIAAGATLTISAGELKVRGDLISEGILKGDGGKVIFNNNLDRPSIIQLSGNSYFADLVIGDTRSNTWAQLGSDVRIKGDLLIATRSFLDPSTHFLTIEGDWTDQSGGFDYSYPSVSVKGVVHPPEPSPIQFPIPVFPNDDKPDERELAGWNSVAGEGNYGVRWKFGGKDGQLMMDDYRATIDDGRFQCHIDAWLFLPVTNLLGNTAYQLSFDFKNSTVQPQKPLAVALYTGNSGQLPSLTTQEIGTQTIAADDRWTPVSQTIRQRSTGATNIGIRVSYRQQSGDPCKFERGAVPEFPAFFTAYLKDLKLTPTVSIPDDFGKAAPKEETPEVDPMAWKAFSAGGKHALAIRGDGTLWGWGQTSTYRIQRLPVQIGTDQDWKKVFTGNRTSFAIKNDGSLWAWGDNYDGLLGIGTKEKKEEPTRVGEDNDWEQLSVGSDFVVAKKTDGSIWAWGKNYRGQLGIGSNDAKTEPTRVGAESDWQQVATGHDHVIALKKDGSLWSWGNNEYGQLGNGTNENSNRPKRAKSSAVWSAIAVGSWYNSAIKEDGSIWSWGVNHGLYMIDNTWEPISEPQPVEGAPGPWKTIAVSEGHTLAIKADGTLWSWGINLNGVLGDGTIEPSKTPLQIGEADNWTQVTTSFSLDRGFNLALNKAGRLFAWGNNFYGQLGDGTEVYQYTPLKISEDKWQEITVGEFHSLGIKDDGTLWSWGHNVYGELGDGTKTFKSRPKQIGTDKWKSVVTGRYFTAAIQEDGSLWTWGANYNGQLGDGTKLLKTKPEKIGDNKWQQLASGMSHTVAIDEGGKLWSWGDNEFGQVGNQAYEDQFAPAKISDESWKAVTSGSSYSAGIKADGSFWAWGQDWNKGTSGEPKNLPQPIGTATDWEQLVAPRFGAAQPIFILKSDKTLWGQGNGYNWGIGSSRWPEEFKDPQQIEDPGPWKTIQAGYRIRMGIKADGTLWAWGNGQARMFGRGAATGKTSTVEFFSPVQIGSDQDWQQVAIGTWHVAALKTDGTLWAWGAVASGLLGDGRTDFSMVPVEVKVPE